MIATVHSSSTGLNAGAALRLQRRLEAAGKDRDSAAQTETVTVVAASARPLGVDLDMQARAARSRAIGELGARLTGRGRQWAASLLLNLRRRHTHDDGRGRIIQC